MRAIHILKDGTQVDDITGHVVRYEDCPEFYDIILRAYLQQLEELQNDTEENKK